jgi:salicylate hydroxylase
VSGGEGCGAPDDLPAAFHAYQQQRYLRTGRVQIMSRVYGEFYHARGVASELRDMALGSRSQKDSFEAIEWLYGGP